MTHTTIVNTKSFNPEQSGSTALISILSDKTLTCVNTGNCRAVLFKEANGKIVASQVTTDHDTYNEKEIKRVTTWGAVVRAPIEDQNGRLRVYKED